MLRPCSGAASDKLAGHLFECRIRLIVAAVEPTQAVERLRVMAAAFGAFSRYAVSHACRIAQFHVFLELASTQ